jgi:hypothetical protein
MRLWGEKKLSTFTTLDKRWEGLLFSTPLQAQAGFHYIGYIGWVVLKTTQR